jgi:hypothetical protein
LINPAFEAAQAGFQQSFNPACISAAGQVYQPSLPLLKTEALGAANGKGDRLAPFH